MSYLIFGLHGILILMLAIFSWRTFKFVKVPITVHNLPIILLIGLGLCVTAWWSGFNPEFFIPTGVLFGFLVFIINSVKIPNQVNPTLFKNICASLICVMFWPEFIVFFYITSKYLKKNNEKSEY